MNTPPFTRIERLVAENRATYFSAGISATKGAKYFVTIWARPASDTLACGHGNTFDEAALNALAKIDGAPTVPELPGFMTR